MRSFSMGAARAAAVLILSMFAFAGCGDNVKIEPTLVEIQIDPASPSVAAGTGVQLTATATFEVYPNRTLVTRDVTADVTWSSAAKASVEPGGFAKGLVKGDA